MTGPTLARRQRASVTRVATLLAIIVHATGSGAPFSMILLIRTKGGNCALLIAMKDAFVCPGSTLD
jgi:hypothetical protein